MKRNVIDGGAETKPSVAFGRVLRCAEGFALGRGHPALTGAEVLVPIFFETLSPAARFLGGADYADDQPNRTNNSLVVVV